MIQFRCKNSSSSKDDIVKEIGDFILKNKVFFDIFCDIMVRCSKLSDYNKSFIDTLFLIYYPIDLSSSLVLEFKSKLDEFFNTTDNMLNKRRGDVVEYILEKITPRKRTSSPFIKETEFYIYYKGYRLGTSNHDIDLGIYCDKDKFVELYECKVKLENFLYDRPPLKRKSRRKLGYLKEVYRRIQDIDKDIYLVCLEENLELYRDTLDKYGYAMISILSRNDIENLVKRF
ncbi:hypothetical protein SAMN02745135_00821 [Caloranaerobacter azorensis DSM 13643]|uniref:Uncharacterized protein n=1 Tax=Caloranaerobacter azorensis DSM 13643 TaxID=1121264 RepID=A0A1M5T0F8_9FIRM|nr:hypothetical protein [Caloranaerobacter azorensis]SHH44267.1 hypothetical protein SAMN02745135_00821 [Caloranaerobacter azorensis DSM 13643]